jgi:hypothetical protein
MMLPDILKKNTTTSTTGFLMRTMMGKMKAYMMDLQEEADYAISEGANSAAEVIMHMRNSGMPHVDEHWVTKYFTEKCGES